MKYTLINQNFANRINRSLGQIVTKKDLELYWGDYTDLRIEKSLNVLIKKEVETPKKDSNPDNSKESHKLILDTKEKITEKNKQK